MIFDSHVEFWIRNIRNSKGRHREIVSKQTQHILLLRSDVSLTV